MKKSEIREMINFTLFTIIFGELLILFVFIVNK